MLDTELYTFSLKLYCNTHELLLLQCCLSERANGPFSLAVYLNPEGHVYLNQFLDSPSKQNVKRLLKLGVFVRAVERAMVNLV